MVSGHVFFAFFISEIYFFYVYSFWIGAKFVYEGYENPNNGENYTAGTLLVTLFAILTGTT